jgi:ribose 5-phosphate isomerase B
MQSISDEQLHILVEKIVRQTVGAMMTPFSNPTTTPIETQKPDATIKPVNPSDFKKPDTTRRVVAIGTDHGGVDLKNTLKTDLTELGFEVIDCGTHTKDAVDYPDIAQAVAQLVASGKAWRGVVIDGAGIGSCMAANKVPGIRAAMCHDYATAVNSREHNDANVLTLGAGLIGVNLAKQILKTWLATEYAGGRHAKRVDKIMAIEKSFMKEGK